MYILGAGMAGCLMGALHPASRIFEREASLPHNHQAVLRHRDDAIGRHLGVPFKKVRVHKTCWLDNREVNVTPRLANWYAKKVTRTLSGDRSIWNLAPVDRYIAPPDLHERMGEMCTGRITFGNEITNAKMLPIGRPIVSTLPIDTLAAILGMDPPGDCRHESVYVNRYIITNCDLHQTVYFPEPGLGLYRATLTGEHLIIESVEEVGPADVMTTVDALGLETSELINLTSNHRQRYGKIVPINETERRRFIFEATANHGIYSLGRYATWRNLLLDDVLNDIWVIRRLVGADIYEHRLR